MIAVDAHIHQRTAFVEGAFIGCRLSTRCPVEFADVAYSQSTRDCKHGGMAEPTRNPYSEGWKPATGRSPAPTCMDGLRQSGTTVVTLWCALRQWGGLLPHTCVVTCGPESTVACRKPFGMDLIGILRSGLTKPPGTPEMLGFISLSRTRS